MLLSAVWILNKYRWLVPAATMIAPSPIIYVAVQVLQLFKPFISSSMYEYLDEGVWSSFQRTIIFFYSNMNGTQLLFSGDDEDFFKSKENVLFICNHQTAVDWIAVDMLTVQQNLMGRIRFMHKDVLKYIPFFGLYFWQHSCVNVGRHGTFDQSKTVRQLKHLRENNIPTWLVVFPEGTRYNPENANLIAKSQQFAEKSARAVLQHSLTPRSRGTYLALRELHSHLDAVYDVTIAYEDTRRWSTDAKRYTRGKAPGMVDFILSYSPRMHAHIRRIDINSVPHESEEEVAQWLHGCFERKERLLDRFTATGQLVDGDGSYRAVSRWSQTLPYTIIGIGMTISCLAFRSGRIVYVSSTLIGSLAGMIWMKFH